MYPNMSVILRLVGLFQAGTIGIVETALSFEGIYIIFLLFKLTNCQEKREKLTCYFNQDS